MAQNNSDGDYDVYHTILNSFNDVEERSLCLMTESRKILFCAIFSYYETMLNEFVLYYKIANNATLPSQILDSIRESRIPDASHAVRQYKFGQATATFESITPDARHAVRQCQFGHATATQESRFPDARNAIFDCRFSYFIILKRRIVIAIVPHFATSRQREVA